LPNPLHSPALRRAFLLPHRRCRFLKPAGSSGCPLLLFDPFAPGSQLLSVGSLVRCISLAGNSRAAVQQLMSQGVAHAQRMAAAGAFAALPLEQQPAEMDQQEMQLDQQKHIMAVQQQQQHQEGLQKIDCSIDLQGEHDQQPQQVLPTQQYDKLAAGGTAEVVNMSVNCGAVDAAAAECAAAGCTVCAAGSS
jgi:hypothetical protein